MKKIKKGLYFLIYGLVKYIPTPVGDICRFLVLKMFMKKINTMHIREGTTFLNPENISIRKNVGINEWVWMDGSGGIEIKDNVMISPRVTIASFDHGYEDINIPMRDQDKKLGRILIEENVWLCAHVVVTSNVKIGTGAIVGAGSVVTKDIPPNTICGGVPARVIKKRG